MKTSSDLINPSTVWVQCAEILEFLVRFRVIIFLLMVDFQECSRGKPLDSFAEKNCEALAKRKQKFIFILSFPVNFLNAGNLSNSSIV